MKTNDGKIYFGLHPKLDPDETAAIYLKLKKEGKRPEDVEFAVILSEGNELLTIPFKNVEILDRGCGDLDHHVQERSEKGETATSLMAQKLGMMGETYYQQLIDEIRRSDLQGITQPFTMCYFIKCAQRDSNLDDKQRLALGFRIIDDTMEFRRRQLKRNNSLTQKILVDFLVEKKGKVIPENFQRYINNVTNERFKHPFDLAEIIATEKTINGEEEAVRFTKAILKIVYRDDMMFYRADEAIKKTPYKSWIRNIFVVANNPEDPTLDVKDYLPKFGTRARFNAKKEENAAVVIQRDEESRTQIFFDTDAKNENNGFVIGEDLIQDVVSVVRLEECLIQGRESMKEDLQQPGTVNGIPEWHFFCPPQLHEKTGERIIPTKRPGRNILNGSLTAPDVPRSKIPLPILFQTVCSVVKFQPFNWKRWVEERVKYYQSRKSTT